MKYALISLISLSFMACGQAPVPVGSTQTQSTATTSSNSTKTNTVTAQTVASFSIKTTAAAQLINSSGTILVQDESNGDISFGDNNSEPKRAVVAFPLSSLSGVTLKSATLRFTFDSVGASTFFTNMGSLRIYKIGSTASFDTTTYSAAESNATLLMSSATGYVQGRTVEIDISSILQASINAHDSYLTLKVRTDNTSSTNNNILNFYCAYTSTILADKVPVIVGTY